MPGKDALALLRELAQGSAEAARRRLGEALGECRRSEARLRTLEGYRAEYEERLARAAANGVSAALLDNHRAFLDRLAEAIARAAAEVDAGRRQVDAGRAGVRAEDERLQRFDVLAERRAREATRAEARAEQKMTDEAAARVAGRSGARS